MEFSTFENIPATVSRQVKTAVLSELSSKQWRDLGTAITERSFFSSRVVIAEFMNQLRRGIDSILNPKAGDRFHPSGVPVLEGSDLATVRANAKILLKELSYQPELGKEGTIEDLRTDQRLNLIINTNVQMAQGYAQYMQGQDDNTRFDYPAAEFYRLEDRKIPRVWEERWPQAAIASGDMTATRHGRFIARIDSDIWNRLGTLWDDSLGNPYPPFAFNSGMWIRRIDRDTAMMRGVINSWETPAARSRGFNDRLEMSAADMESELRGTLMDSLGSGWEIDGKSGIIRRVVNTGYSNAIGVPHCHLPSLGTAIRYVDPRDEKKPAVGQSVTLKLWGERESLWISM